MTDLKLTSYSEGFGIFNKVAEEEFDVINKNYLRMFMLNTENKIFTYDELYDYILSNITKYVFSRKRLAEIANDPIKQGTIILDALSHLRNVNNGQDKGAGGELGEILLYLFLEQDMKAPKLLSKVEFKTNPNEYIKGSDGIHFKFRTKEDGTKVMQLVIGEAKIKNELDQGIHEAFESIEIFLSQNIQDRSLLDTHLMSQLVDENEAIQIKEYITAIPRKKRETIFGIFIGYSINYDGTNDSNDEYDEKVVQENINQILAVIQYIVNKINKYKLSNYEFNFYFLPFNDAARDRRVIMESLKAGNPKLVWGDIKNG